MLTETCWCPPMVQKTAKKHRKVETGRFSSGHFLVVSSQRFLGGQVPKKQTVATSWSSAGQFRS